MAKIQVEGSTASPVALVPISPVGDHGSETLGASKFTPVRPVGVTRYLLVQALVQNVRFTLDGTDPTATVGFQLLASDPAVLIPMGPDLQPQFFREVAGAILQYQWVE